MSAPMERPIWDEDVNPPLSGPGCVVSLLFALAFWGIVIGVFRWFT